MRKVGKSKHTPQTTRESALQRVGLHNQPNFTSSEEAVSSLEASSLALGQSGFFHDFSRVPVHSPASGPTCIQAKLKIGQAGDKYEQEADRIAEQVMRMPNRLPAFQPFDSANSDMIRLKPVDKESTVPFWNQLPAYAQKDLAPPGYNQKWFDQKSATIRLTALNLYVKLKGMGLWKYVLKESSTQRGCLEFLTDVRALKQDLRGRWNFRDPENSMEKWDSAEKRATGSLHFKHFKGWSSSKVQAHIDQAGLWLGSKSWWWAGIPVTGIRHLIAYDSYQDVFGMRKILLRQGWDPQPLLGMLTGAIQQSIQIQRREVESKKEEEEFVQTEQTNGQAFDVNPALKNQIQTLRGNGNPLSKSVRAFFEPRFGYDFSGVRVHTDEKADSLNRQLNAHAFTTGQDIFFRQGTYISGNSSDRGLLAHELTHVVQQTDGPHRKMALGRPGDIYEQEADEVAGAIMRLKRQSDPSGEINTHYQRQPGAYRSTSSLNSRIAAIAKNHVEYQKLQPAQWQSSSTVQLAPRAGSAKATTKIDIADKLEDISWEVLLALVKEGSFIESYLKKEYDIEWIDKIKDAERKQYSLANQIDGAYSQWNQHKAAKRLLKAERTKFQKKHAAEFRKRFKKKSERRKALKEETEKHLKNIEPELTKETARRRIKPRGVKESVFATFPKEGLTPALGRIVARIDFMATMHGVFGSNEKVKTHFQGIRKARIKGRPKAFGIVYLSESAASRLEDVNKAFTSAYPKLDFPKSYVAQALRSRHQQRHSRGMLGHPLGLSIDYYAYENPHLPSEDLRLLLETVGDGPTRLVFRGQSGREYGFAKRRRIIAALGRGEAGEEGERLLAQTDDAYKAVVRTSETFKAALNKAEIEKLEQVGKEHWWPVRSEVLKLRKRLKRADRWLNTVRRRAPKQILNKRRKAYLKRIEKAWLEAREELRESHGKGGSKVTSKEVNNHPKVKALIKERDTITQENIENHEPVKKAREYLKKLRMRLDELTKPLKEKLPTLLQPLTQKIEKRIEELQPKLEGFAVAPLPTNKALRRVRLWVELTRTDRRRSRQNLIAILNNRNYAGLFARIDPKRFLDNALLKKEMLREIDRAAVAMQIAKLERVKKTMQENFDFILGAGLRKDVQNPPVLQLLKLGFIRSDVIPERATEKLVEGEQPITVFNSIFVKVMMEHGFDPGAAWSSADIMHFDFVEGFGAIQSAGGTFGPEGFKPRRRHP